MKTTVRTERYYLDEMTDEKQRLDFLKMKVTVQELSAIRIRGYNAYWFYKNSPKDARNLLDGTANSPAYAYARSLGLSSYYANILDPVITGIYKSQETNRKNRIDDIKADIRETKKKLKSLKSSFANTKKLKQSLIRYGRTGKFSKPYRYCRLGIDSDGMMKGTQEPCTWQEYERTIDERIRSKKARIGQITDRLNRLEQKLKKAKAEPPKRSIFGGRRFYKTKDTVGCDGAWKRKFHDARYSLFTVGGRADLDGRNAVVLYENGGLTWTLPFGLGKARLEKFVPVRLAKEYYAALENPKYPIAYTFAFKTDRDGREYMTVSVCFTVPDERKAFDASHGVIGVDLNADHFAWTETSPSGERMKSGVIQFDVLHATKGQTDEALGRAVAELIEICTGAKKPLVMEDLSLKSARRGIHYQGKLRNRIISQFAFDKMTALIASRAERNGVPVRCVNPAYTSLIGKTVYMRKYGISIHEAASYAVALRGARLEPPLLPSGIMALVPEKKRDGIVIGDWSDYFRLLKALQTAVKEIPKHMFYLPPERIPH